jgi:hypothetical protein
MPTGYTEAISKGISFNQYALDCARAFGATVPLRDHPGGGEIIPEKFEPSDYHTRKLAEAQQFLAGLEAMDDQARDASYCRDYRHAEEFRLNGLARIKELREKYEAMLKQVEAWTPPSDDHSNLKQFMRSQILDSVRVDCNDAYYQTPTPVISPAEWLAEKKAHAQRDIEYHTKQQAEEVARTDGRNEWIKQLRESLKT